MSGLGPLCRGLVGAGRVGQGGRRGGMWRMLTPVLLKVLEVAMCKNLDSEAMGRSALY